MSFINPVIQNQNLINDIQDIGTYVGYYWNLIPVNGAIVNDKSVSFTTATQQAYSSVSHTPTWSMSMTMNLNSNICLGMSTNLSEVFSGASSVGMQNINYGLLCDNQSISLLNIYPVVNGIFSPAIATPANQTSTIKINYDGNNLTYYVNNNLINTISVSILDNCYLVVGSFYGGSVNNILFTGSSSGSGSVQNLKETLTIGNDAGSLDIKNINDLFVNNNISGESITADYQVSAVIQMQSPLYIGNSNNISFASDTTKNKGLSLQSISGSGPNSGEPYLALFNQSNTKNSRVYDNVFNTPMNNYNFSFANSGPSKTITPTHSTSIIQFPINKDFNNYNMNISRFEFTYDSNGTSIPSGQGLFQFYITDIKDDIPYPLYGNSFITPDISGSGKFISTDNIILDYTNVNINSTLYLNVLINYDNGRTYDLNDFILDGQIICNTSPINTITPIFTI